MNESPGTSEGPEDVPEEIQELPGDLASPEPVQAEIESEPARRPWKKVAAWVGGGVALVAGAVVATLAATHKSAVRENAAAYANGLLDGASGDEDDDDFDNYDFDHDFEEDCWYCTGMTMRYCPECHRADDG